MNQKYVVQLSEIERAALEKVISSGQAPARLLTRARILLKSDSSPGRRAWSYEQLQAAFDVSEVTIADVRRRYVMGGLAAALQRKKPAREYQYSLDGEGEAHLIAIACSSAPEGRERWTLKLLQQEMIKRQHVKTISHETIRTVLKKMNLSLG
jgi:transposase